MRQLSWRRPSEGPCAYAHGRWLRGELGNPQVLKNISEISSGAHRRLGRATLNRNAFQNQCNAQHTYSAYSRSSCCDLTGRSAEGVTLEGGRKGWGRLGTERGRVGWGPLSVFISNGRHRRRGWAGRGSRSAASGPAYAALWRFTSSA